MISVLLLWPRDGPTSPGGSSRAGEATGLSALRQVENGLPNGTVEIWTPFSNLGISSAAPFAPSVVGGNQSGPQSLRALWACRALPITSVWNVSEIPVRGGNLSDGYAPFWQFMFSNLSTLGVLTFAIGTYVSGSVQVVGPLAESNGCVRSLGIGNWANLTSQPTVDTNFGGPRAYKLLASAISQMSGTLMIWDDGWLPILNNGLGAVLHYGSSWDAEFYGCSQVGVESLPRSTISAIASVYASNGTVVVTPVATTIGNCTWPRYNASESNESSIFTSAGSALRVTLSVLAPGQGVALGLTAWMVSPQVYSGGPPNALPVGRNGCPAWVSNESAKCLAPSKGWYAVLSAPDGGWLDSYGETNGTPGWACPGVSVTTNESLTILSASTLSGVGDFLTFVSLVGNPQITTFPLSL